MFSTQKEFMLLNVMLFSIGLGFNKILNGTFLLKTLFISPIVLFKNDFGFNLIYSILWPQNEKKTSFSPVFLEFDIKIHFWMRILCIL